MNAERRPEWRIPPPPFKGSHTEASKTKNRLSNVGKKRSPDFGPRISAIMIDVWKREDYKKKRVGKKRGAPSKKTREKIGKSLEKRWKKDKKYRRKMLGMRRTPEWQTRLRQNLEKILKDRKAEREANLAIANKARADLKEVDSRDEVKDIWNYVLENGLLEKLTGNEGLSPDEFDSLQSYYGLGEGKKPNETILDKFSMAVANLS